MVNSPRSVLKRNNRVEERKASSLEVKREQKTTKVRAQKMMRGRVEPYVVPTMVWAMSIVVHATRETTKVPQMTSSQEEQLKEQREEVP
jgi:hypothetical protein